MVPNWVWKLSNLYVTSILHKIVRYPTSGTLHPVSWRYFRRCRILIFCNCYTSLLASDVCISSHGATPLINLWNNCSTDRQATRSQAAARMKAFLAWGDALVSPNLVQEARKWRNTQRTISPCARAARLKGYRLNHCNELLHIIS